MKSLIVLAFLVPGAALAEPRSDRGHVVAISASPLHLVLPVAELQVEWLATPSFSAAIIGGAGQVTATSSSGDVTFSVIEVGAQVRGYFYGSTEGGAFGGAEVLHVVVDSDDFDGDVTGVGVGTEVAAIAGYKWTWDHFFIDLNGGAGILFAEATATDGEDTSEAKDSQVIPVLNFNLGASF